jgi:hypothetical protein
MNVLPKHLLQSKPPLSQKSVLVMSEPEVVELSDPEVVELSELAECAGLSELEDGVVPLESDPDEEQLSMPDLLSPGV